MALWNQASLPDGADDAAGPISLGRRSPARHTLDLGHSERRRELDLDAADLGKPTLGFRTRNKKKASTQDIVRSRKRGKGGR